MELKSASAVAVLLIAVLNPSSRPAAAPYTMDSTFTVVRVVGGLVNPTTMSFIGWNEFLVLEKNKGTVRWVKDGVLNPTPSLDVAVNFRSTRGLLGIVAHPQFDTNHWVYLFYNGSTDTLDTWSPDLTDGIHVVRYTWNDGLLTDPLEIFHKFSLDGPGTTAGVMSFGTDGMLYVAIGSLDHHGYMSNKLHDPQPDTSACVLRMTDEGLVPPDNPFSDDPGMELVYAYGIRNTFGLATDPVTGSLWCTENGTYEYDEINRLWPGMNSGWERVLGPIERKGTAFLDSLWFCTGATYGDPVFSWWDTVAPTAICFPVTGRYGAEIPQSVLVGDNNYGNIYRFPLTPTRDDISPASAELEDRVLDSLDVADPLYWARGFSVLTDIEVGPDGFVYAVGMRDSSVFRIESPVVSAGEGAHVAREPLLLRASVSSENSVLFSWRQAGPAPATLSVYRVDGRRIGVLTARAQPSGECELRWDGRTVPSGIYSCRLDVDGRSSTARVFLVR